MTTTTITTSNKEKKMTAKSYYLSTELFKDKKKDIPDFIANHRVFSTPFKIKKIFPSIGLHNFSEPCDLVKPLFDSKKDNFVTVLVNAMIRWLSSARDEALNYADMIQYLASPEEKKANIGKLDTVYNLVVILRNLIPQLEMRGDGNEQIIQTVEGKIGLRLVQEVCDKNGKPIFRKNESLFKVFAKLREQFGGCGLQFVNLEQTAEFKTFCVENMPNKKYQVVFSSDGPTGAWDLLTMSMRGIKSCQRWDGDYPRCLIGSIVSKFVGIIYLTSGADYDGKGSKMMRRALVRYAIDADEQRPCLLIDKLYPQQQGADVDEETLKIFKKALSSKTSLPIHFAPSLGNKTKHFYIPFEKIRSEIPEREWTYQDTPLKTSLDFQLHVLASASNEDINRYINCFRTKFITYMGEAFRDILNNKYQVDSEITRTISNIRLNYSIDKFNECLAKIILDRFAFSLPPIITEPREHYRKYLIKLALSLKTIKQQQFGIIAQQINQATTRTVNHEMFCNFLFGQLIKNLIIRELKDTTTL